MTVETLPNEFRRHDMSAKTFVCFGLVLSGVMLAAGSARVASAQDITPRVKQIYKNDCALCHGENGNGKSELATSMNLVLLDYTDPKSLSGKSDQELFDAIRKGRGDKMPPEEEGRAKDADVRGLVAYVRGLSKGHTGTQTAEAPATAPPGKL
jgi:mono/diheme cytochrome c family protein